MSALFALLLLTSTPPALAAQVDLSPSFKGRKFVAVRGTEAGLSPEQRLGLIMSRATQVCEFFKQPAGRFRRYRATKLETGRVERNGTEALMLVQRQPRVVKIPAGEAADVFTKMRCIGYP